MKSQAKDVRRLILELSHQAHVGHIGPCLSVVEILTALYFQVLRVSAPDAADRDRFVLAKGHAALALYCVLRLKGVLGEAELRGFLKDGSLLGVHPEHAVPGVDFSTGSLGQGLSLGVGSALAAKMQRSNRRTFVLVSDAECNEGALWEAAMFAAHHKLSNLTVVVDLNGQQALGYTRDVLDLEPYAPRWQAFGWDPVEVDGHDEGALAQALSAPAPSERPRVVLARTLSGKGVSFMERQVAWHYLPMTDAQYAQALQELAAR